jgi:hypothetical protein
MPGFKDYDASVSGLSMPVGVQGYNAATGSVPVASGVSPAMPAGATVKGNGNGNGAMMTNGKILGQPSKWWFVLALVYFGLVWVSRKYGGPQISHPLQNLWSLALTVLFYVLMLNLLKVLATRFPVPGLSELIIAA